ncbi:hypothetical protein [Sphingomonas xinjiangensis]|uniref:Uncharacterized protein n=1 Tax=Sphingomonas xinjiangensis TaxID=643568 RepID=A0A840YKX5_9SPHN|nr:hypothetical protein [Sphingomonas xinjiangensis]MBB5711888.1 hypothetical protein [Sphingomonas xinjiangensis]
MIRLAVPAALLLTLGATSAGTQTRAPDRATARVEKTLAGLTPGAPQRCLRRDRVTELRTAPNVILYVAGRDRVWRNDVVGEGCARGLARGDIVVSRNLVSGEYCSGDLIHMRVRTGGTLTGTCSLGQFVPYTRNR